MGNLRNDLTYLAMVWSERETKKHELYISCFFFLLVFFRLPFGLSCIRIHCTCGWSWNAGITVFTNKEKGHGIFKVVPPFRISTQELLTHSCDRNVRWSILPLYETRVFLASRNQISPWRFRNTSDSVSWGKERSTLRAASSIYFQAAKEA